MEDFSALGLSAGLNPTAFALLPPEYEPSIESDDQPVSLDEDRSRGVEDFLCEMGGW